MLRIFIVLFVWYVGMAVYLIMGLSALGVGIVLFVIFTFILCWGR